MKRLEDLAKEGDSPVYSLMVRLFKSNAAKLGSLRSEKGPSIRPIAYKYREGKVNQFSHLLVKHRFIGFTMLALKSFFILRGAVRPLDQRERESASKQAVIRRNNSG